MKHYSGLPIRLDYGFSGIRRNCQRLKGAKGSLTVDCPISEKMSVIGNGFTLTHDNACPHDIRIDMRS